jgi:hypothetical protein
VKRLRKPQWLGGLRGLFHFLRKGAILRGMKITAKRISLLLIVITLTAISGCTESDNGKVDKPATVFEPSVPDRRTDAQKIADFTVVLERKYKREDLKNTIDLHFSQKENGRIKVRLTYDRDADPTLVSSVADAAVELAKRLKREDPSLRDVDVAFDREVVRREE